jgi:CubicO group peptidase (beta-lactamase class C family)
MAVSIPPREKRVRAKPVAALTIEMGGHAILQSELDTAVDEILNRWPAIGLAVGVVRSGRLDVFSVRGIADISSNTLITEDTVFRIGSITKTFTAIAVMQLWERGLIDLDAPANDYLRAYRLVPVRSGWRPATLRHLLTHTAGISELLRPSGLFKQLFGETVQAGQPVPSPAEYYRGELRIDAEPGTRFIYTDHDFTTLGQIVEDVSGEPFDGYLRDYVFEPLGMRSTDVIRSDRVRSHLASGYVLGAHGAKPVDDYEVVTVGGGAAYSTARDMARYLAALTGGGSNEHGSVLEPATLAMLFAPQYQPDLRIPGLGLAFTRFNVGGHLAVEHGGIVPGFNSQIFVAPDDGVGVMAFTNGSQQAMFWMPGELSKVLKQMLGVPDDVIRTNVPHHPEIWGDLCGRYRLSAGLTDVRARLAMGGAVVFVRRGQLRLRFLSPIRAMFKARHLHPDDDADPYVFRIDLSDSGMGTTRVVFSREPGGETSGLYYDLMPFTVRKQRGAMRPKGNGQWR